MSQTVQISRKSSKTARVVLRTLLLVFVISLVVTPTILHNYFGYKISPILSGSMSPFAEPGDAFITIDRPASELKVGDIVTLYSDTSMNLFAHRIINIRPFNGQLRIVTKGDSNPTEDADPFLVSRDKQIPVTVFRVKEIGKALVYMTSLQGRQAGLALVVIANVLALLLAMFKKKIRERNLRAEQIYKDLFSDVSSEKLQVIKKTQVYKDLLSDVSSEKSLILKKAQVYKDLYAESQNKLEIIKEK